MQRICFVLRIRPDKIEEYRKGHAAVWPTMQQALRHADWRNYSLFLNQDGLLIGYFETDDWVAAWQKMQDAPVNDLWQQHMAQCFEPLNDTTPDRGILPLPEVFHLD
jgi:L-rhamnose mutarotase